ncbi:hypothetical protein HQ865_00780 [Mucilaginibacter mali]|uniref:Uncharacterized protein n=1 Tax=Mucilaginibacter mali TaxID=2740462 RepID=A0A7D4TJZ0_9SPHI|nr:hypothetical protein [Mucilaginibacter mali]QKJ28353.1 hypothetical protein HQ865_00780 [Mucilaginibacter mali]
MILYGERTSATATSLIIDFFNRWKGDAPYIMKTITAIYKKNDQIFNDLSRYPIDAPFRPYYDELTKYAGEYQLDDLFFNPDGSIGEGYYYFQFAYDARLNKFLVSESPAEISRAQQERYIPMLYSMVTDAKIDWQEAKYETIEVGQSYADEKQILLVFGEASSQTLQFSWLATFELISQLKNVKVLAEEISARKEILINAVQGVLFSQLDDVIIEILRAKDQLAHTRELIKDHKHTLKNFGFRGVMASLYHSIKEKRFTEALEDYTRVENLSILRDYATDILYNFDADAGELLLKQHGFDTFTSILNLIHSATQLAGEKRIIYSEEVEQHPLNHIKTENIPSLFTVLLNLYSNSRNKGKSDYLVNLEIVDENKLMIIFTNAGEMQEKYRDFFLSSSAMSGLKGEGISFIKSALSTLKHIQRACETRDGRTIITLTVDHET